jgi:hypothetical protein
MPVHRDEYASPRSLRTSRKSCAHSVSSVILEGTSRRSRDEILEAAGHHAHVTRRTQGPFWLCSVAKPKALTGAAVHGGVRPARLCGSPATANGKLLAVMRSSQLMTIMLLYRHTSDHAHARGPSRVRVRPSGAPALQGQGPHPTARCSPPSAAREE